MKISAIILTLNEEKHIQKCINTLKWVDEIIVVDNGSTDKTIELVEKAGARHFSSTSKSFSVRRWLGAQKAKGDWLLYVDADERVTPELRQEIQSLIKKQKLPDAAYAIPRKNTLLGKEMKHGGWWPDKVLRLIQKKALKGYKGKLHEQPIIKGEIGNLTNHLKHYTHESLTEMVDKTNNWSEIEANLLFKAKHPPVRWFHFMSAGFREFWFRFIRHAAFLDGVEGVIEASFQVFNKLVIYAKLWEIQHQTSNN